MKPFLKQVAEHYYDIGDIDKTCLIFPNRRSMVFFGKWLAETVKNDARTTPLQAPVTITMNDFFYRVGKRGPADRISLYHYISIAGKNCRDHLRGERVRAKK